ncbi:MAG TPA: AAA family ATPase, partial [Bryobacteraceae bacterium]|nr:AAA family ATPase [Bryobacteraceae bacterium]
MLLELMVENLAVVERLRLRFGAGLNVLTGETGSGKSIVVDAFNLLLGGRASAEMVRSGTDRTRVAGVFALPDGATQVLEAAGIETEEEELLIEREVTAAGKSRAFVANRPATAALLRDLAPYLGEIHGQHDQQRLLSPESQRDILDEYAGCEELLRSVAASYRSWSRASKELQELEGKEQEQLRLLDLWTFQRDEIAKAQLKPGEDVELENERRVLQNVTRLLENASQAYDALYEAEGSAYAQVRAAMRRLEDLTRIDGSLEAVVEALKPAQIAVSEASSTLRDYVAKLEADPQRLEEVESRLAAIDKLRRKYGATVEEILEFLA